MTRTFRYRIYPTKAQSKCFITALILTRELYNAALQERIGAWKLQSVSVSKYDQHNQLPAIRKERADVANISIVVLRGALNRLDKAFKNFFRRCKSSDKKPGFPRFKSASQWNSLIVEDLDKKSPIVAGGKRLKIPLLGKIKLNLHRPLEGRPRKMSIKLEKDGKWHVFIVCDSIEQKPLTATGSSVGIDLGLSTFVATSDGEMFENPRPLKHAKLLLERAQRRVSHRKKGSKRRKKAVRILAKHHAHVANIRRENHILVAKSLVAKYDTICVEDLNVKGLADGMLAKSVSDAGWGNFLHWLDVKAESAARQVIRVDPRYTSQKCSSCGNIVKKSLAVRVHDCKQCGLILDRDVNAAINVKALGMSVQGAALLVKGQRRSAKYAKIDIELKSDVC